MVCMHIGNNPNYSESLELGKSRGPSHPSNTKHRTLQENLESRKGQEVPFWGPPGDSACWHVGHYSEDRWQHWLGSCVHKA